MSTAREPVSYHLASEQGRQIITASDGHQVPWFAFGCSSEREMDIWKQKQRPFIRSGAQVYQITIWPSQFYFQQPFWSLDGEPVLQPRTTMTLGEQAEWLLEQQPDAHFLVRFGAWPDPLWRGANLNEFTPLNFKSAFYGDRYSVNPSLASQAYLKQLDRHIRDVVAWCEKQPWRNRIIGYSAFPYGEGATELCVHGMLFDRSRPMQQAFKRFAKEKYETDEALQKAWADPFIKLENVTVPSEEEWFAKKERLAIMTWPDPAKVQRERDYFTLQRECFRNYLDTMFTALAEATAQRPCLKGYDVLKQHMQGWMLIPRFDGDYEPDSYHRFPPTLFASGAFDLSDMLDHPGLDLLHTPGMYFNRAMGYAWEAEGLSDSLALRGKLNFMEADMRTWVTKDRRGQPQDRPVNDAGAFLTVPEARAGFDRALAWAISRNQMFYLMNVFFGNWWYDDPKIEPLLVQMQQTVQASQQLPWRDTRNAICVVIDDSAPMDTDFSAAYDHIAVQRQIEESVALSGVPYRIHLLEDLKRDNFPNYKTYLFPNLFRIDDKTENLLNEKVLRNGNVAIFGPATGITDGQTRDGKPASRLLGVPMKLTLKSVPRRIMLQDRGHPLSAKLANITFGSDLPFGPILTPVPQRLDGLEGVTELGECFYYYFFNQPGIFIKEFGKGAAGNAPTNERGADDYAVVFSAAVPLPPVFIREAARYAGGQIYSEQNAVVYASDNFIGLHSARSGEHTLHFPRADKVVNFKTGEVLATDVNRLKLDIEAPDTVLLELRR